MNRDGRAALSTPASISFHAGPHESGWIHTGVKSEPLVLFKKKRVDDFGRDVPEWCPQTVLIVGCERDAE
jgi:hypothetical protein